MTSIKVPPLGESIVEATVSRWLKNEGDAVAPGDTLVELETDKITVEVPSVTGGVLKKQFAKEGDVVKLDQMLAEIDENGTGGKTAAAAPAAMAAAPAPAAAPIPKVPAPVPAPGREAPRAAPSAQRMAAESGADLSRVQGTGRGGVVSKADVIEQRASAAPTPASNVIRQTSNASGDRETREKMTTR